MLPLDDPRWNEMTCARGSAARLPAIIERLQHCLDESTEVDRDPLGELSETCHQWSTYDSTYAIVPHLVQICARTRPGNVGRIEVLAWVGWCVACLRLNRTAAPPELVDWFEESVLTARLLIAESLPHVAVEEKVYHLRTLRSLLAAFAACHGNPGLAFVLYELESGGTKCGHCGNFFEPMKSSLNPFFTPASGV
jgi:hypothetical protein